MKLIILLLLLTVVWAKESLFIDFKVLGAMIGPAKNNGSSWDGSKNIAKKEMSSMASLVANSDPYSKVAISVLSEVNRIGLKGSRAPDVMGYIEQTGQRSELLSDLSKMRLTLADKRTKTNDSYTPNFDTGYSGWPISEQTRFRITFIDKDLFKNDDIGKVEITYKDIVSAIEKGVPIWVKVAEQSMNQILFVQITANISVKNSVPKFEGYQWSGR